jgi:PleD family two-component response regulator
MSEQDKPNILIVDDTPENLHLLSRMLMWQNYKVRAANNGLMALKSARVNPPDLVLLDIVMPEMDGYETCEQLKADAQTRDIPVIFISALDRAFDKVRAFEVGGVDYVTKPFQAEEVLARVATHLALRALQIRLEDANARLEEQNRELQARNEALQQALDAIKTLSGLIPICAWCGSKIKDDAGQWVQVEVYIKDHSDADFTHGICPACLEKVKGQR